MVTPASTQVPFAPLVDAITPLADAIAQAVTRVEPAQTTSPQAAEPGYHPQLNYTRAGLQVTDPAATRPSADLDGDGVLSPVEQRQAAITFAPVLYFAPGEQNFLQDPNVFIEESSLRRERDPGEDWSWTDPGVVAGEDEQVHGTGEVPPEELAGIGPENADADDQLFLDHDNEELGDDIRTGNPDGAVMHYEYDPETNTITYHLFYAYNDGSPDGIGDAQNHEGDWERITVQLDDQFRPSEVRYSAHSGLDVSRAWPGADNPNGQPTARLEGTQPVVYVAQGSHANYPETGLWATEVDGVDDVAALGEGSRRVDLATLEVRDVTTEAWYGSHVLWGERGTLQEAGEGLTSGPTGPSPEKGAITEATPRQPLEAPTPPPDGVPHWLRPIFGG